MSEGSNHWAIRPLALPVGIEPTTFRLTAERSAKWAMEASSYQGSNLGYEVQSHVW